MVVLTVFTVGYEEVQPVTAGPVRAITIGLIVSGCTGMIFRTGALVQFIAITGIQQVLGIKHMSHQIEHRRDHRGGPMKAKATAFLLAEFWRDPLAQPAPHIERQSESHFKSLKYQPHFPWRFGCVEDARGFCRAFFNWYNQDHHHAGIGLMTPDQVHFGQTDAV